MTETGIPCFECGEKSGIDCAGRRPDEATRCEVCMEKFMEQSDLLDRLLDPMEDIIRNLGLPANLVNPPDSESHPK